MVVRNIGLNPHGIHYRQVIFYDNPFIFAKCIWEKLYIELLA